MQQFHVTIGSNIWEYVLSLLSTTENVFAHASIGNVINIAVVGIVQLDRDLNVYNLLQGNNNLINISRDVSEL